MTLSLRGSPSILRWFLLLTLPTESPLAFGDSRADALRFIEDSQSRIESSHRCFNYESLSKWTEKGKQLQEWTRVQSGGEFICESSGIANAAAIPDIDGPAWQEGDTAEIPNRDFYNLSLTNPIYTAEVTDSARFEEEGGRKELESLEAIRERHQIRPGALSFILGEAILGGSVKKFLSDRTTEFVEFTQVDLVGRPAKRLIVEGVIPAVQRSRTHARIRHRCTWEFDVTSGCCLSSSFEPVTGNGFRGGYLVKYTSVDADVWLPALTISTNETTNVVRTIYYRRCNTDCVLDEKECTLKYYGLLEPNFSKSGANLWLVWANIAVICLLAGWALHRYSANTTREPQ